MDAHHDIVKQAIERAGDGTRLYFGYSTILDRDAFLEWRGQHGYDTFELPQGRLAEAVDVSLVYDFPSRWWGGRVAGLADAKGQSVWGCVYEVREKDWPIIQHKEGAVTQMCVERPVRVRLDGKEVEATAFTTNPERRTSDGPVSPRFIEALSRGARAAGLPAPYVERLAASAR